MCWCNNKFFDQKISSKGKTGDLKMLGGTSRPFEMLKNCKRCNCPERGEFPQGLATARTTYVSGQNDKSSQHLLPQQWLSRDTFFFENFQTFCWKRTSFSFVGTLTISITMWTTSSNVSNIKYFGVRKNMLHSSTFFNLS